MRHDRLVTTSPGLLYIFNPIHTHYESNQHTISAGFCTFTQKSPTDPRKDAPHEHVSATIKADRAEIRTPLLMPCLLLNIKVSRLIYDVIILLTFKLYYAILNNKTRNITKG